jgi:hypothetical protein
MALPGVLPGKTAGQRLSSTGPEVPERHSDTEEVTGSNPVRPTHCDLAFLVRSYQVALYGLALAL